ncbi:MULTISPECIES: class II aldolase/adducin family protein [Nocardioides]|uniref:Class II aldolase/adducin family protein n=1 Tax=Nocardioides vastitatis TaxID=2568655 RepID=A0ABW0ZKQ9_9ACTN|nr:class II aldolase/adducin family protein [Nocardioides sp.]THJ16102.1 class II aldolase/adducin family protein [Nocardioides sp.]
MTADLRAAVAAASRRLADAGLLIGTAGNVSVRSGDLVAVTATGVTLGSCEPDDVTVLDIEGNVLEGSLEPTSELSLHLGVYDASPAGAVVHTHAPFATAVACVLDELPVIHYQQLALGGEVRVASYATFGTAELAANVRDALADRSAALLASHGSVAVGATLDKAVENALLLEWLCQLHHRASALGMPRVLSAEQQADVVRVALERGYGSTRPLSPDQSSDEPNPQEPA